MIAVPRWWTLLLFGSALVAASDSSVLGPYDISDVTVSGISSGGYMAVQLHISHSSIVNGSAIFAGGPFYCAEGSTELAINRCMETTLGQPIPLELVDLTIADENLGFIDRTFNLYDDKVFIFSGEYDSVIEQKVVKALEQYYNYFMPNGNIDSEYDIPAEHCMPTLSYGEVCSTLSLPYIGKCQYDGAGKAFETLYGSLNARTEMINDNLKSFKQSSYIPFGVPSSLGENGWIYVPTACQKGETCSLHISLHGCEQVESVIGNQYAMYSGYNEWAESNNIIVLYPYAAISEILPYNPNGCWDWWGYTGPYYGVQEGIQVKFLRNLIRAVSGK